jgi:hypothetical protein
MSSTRNRTPFAIVSVKDNCIRMDKEMFSRLFTKFTLRSFQGTESGLYLSMNIIEAWGWNTGVVTIRMVKVPRLVLVYY